MAKLVVEEQRSMAWLVIFFLIAVNALYMVAEFSAVSLRATQLQPLAQRGDRRAKGLLAVLQDGAELDRYVAACQIGITLSSLIVGAYGQATVALQLAPLFERLGGLQRVAAHSAAALTVLVLLTVLQVLFGELIPKALALQFTLKSGLLTYPPMRLSLKLYAGFLKVLNGSGLLVLRLFGVKPGGHRHVHSPEELELLIAESHEAGVLAPEQQRRLHRALTLGERTAGDLMVPRKRIAALEVSTSPDEVLRRVISSPYTRLLVHEGTLDKVLGMVHTKHLASHFARHGALPPLREGIPLGATPEQVRSVLRQSKHTRYPVYAQDLDHIVGMVHIKDLLRVLSSGQPLTYGNARPVPFVPRTARLDNVLAVMRRDKTQLVVVMDELGGTAGLLTIEDLFEEVVGEIDEGTSTAPVLKSDGDGQLIASGLRRLDEVGRQLGLELAHDEVDTVSGLVLAKLGRPAQVGDVVDYGEVRFEVVALEGRGVKECRIQRLPPAPEVAALEEGAASPS